jgi:Tfp pilus assembly protein PilN
MAQQLNLFDKRFAPVALRFSARQGGLVLAGVLAGAWCLAQGLLWAADRAQADAQAVQAGMAPLRAQVGTLAARPDGTAAELARLQAADATQRRVRAALEAGAAGAREGHAGVLLALARQASDRLWITGLGVSDDGSAIDLEGRMTDSSALADYLRRLNAEPQFKGRPFAQLTLRAVDTNGAALPYTEFALRSTPVATTGATP